MLPMISGWAPIIVRNGILLLVCCFFFTTAKPHDDYEAAQAKRNGVHEVAPVTTGPYVCVHRHW